MAEFLTSGNDIHSGDDLLSAFDHIAEHHDWFPQQDLSTFLPSFDVPVPLLPHSPSPSNRDIWLQLHATSSELRDLACRAIQTTEANLKTPNPEPPFVDPDIVALPTLLEQMSKHSEDLLEYSKSLPASSAPRHASVKSESSRQPPVVFVSKPVTKKPPATIKVEGFTGTVKSVPSMAVATVSLPSSTASSSGRHGSALQAQRTAQPSASFHQKSSPEAEANAKKRRFKIAPGDLYCHSCFTKETPEWRRGPDGSKSLCNACGLRFSKSQKRKDKPQPAPLPVQMAPLQLLPEKQARQIQQQQLQQAYEAQMAAQSADTSSLKLDPGRHPFELTGSALMATLPSGESNSSSFLFLTSQHPPLL
eukprot:TRINITY_DN7586_c0_g1_i2.p1 TRINITY_DN7586_c0_g1~~TRINITY_DN7586_c0_g1_i2.p1  ORF type:complete len:363 (+),score=8.19 TRINITY_DN7586_c0_g1_i2:143-1231(+)